MAQREDIDMMRPEWWTARQWLLFERLYQGMAERTSHRIEAMAFQDIALTCRRAAGAVIR